MEIDPDEVRRLRELRAWSQERLAEIAGLSVRTVQRVERGEGASLETRMALAAALEVELTALCRPADKPAADPGQLPAARPDGLSEQQFRHLMVGLGIAIVFALFLIIGYAAGRDVAARMNREKAECVAEGRTDCA